jgi:hypothetical protein
MTNGNHVWSFSTIGGVKRVNIESASDLLHLSELDPKLWTALSCPVNDLEIDKRTLQLVDTDNDGHIRVPEVIAAVDWMNSVLKDPAEMLKHQTLFPLSAINDATDEGKGLLESAKVILRNLGKENEEKLTVEETSDTERIFAGTAFNGDGVITEDSVKDATLVQLLGDIMTCIGSATDRGAKQGVTAELIQLFFDECEKYDGWNIKREADLRNILPLGPNTEDAYQNYCSIQSKINDYFIRCRLAAFDPQTTEVLNLQVARVATITEKDLSVNLDEIATYPLAKIEPNRSLPVVTGINPAWEKTIASFYSLTIAHLFPGKEHITESEWNKIAGTFAPYAAWKAEKAGIQVEPLGLERIREILTGNYKEQLNDAMQQDLAVAAEATNIILVDKLVRYHRDLFTLLKNFVTFFDFYSPGSKAIFQAGTLYIDQRSCNLCIKVQDMAKHGTMATYSGMYLMYCDCTSKTTNEKMTIVAALTNGDIDNLLVGRNALFYDRKGLDWDATIVKIVDNPISIRQAFFSPYRKVSRFVETQINKFASSQDEKATGDLTKGVENIPLKPDEAKPKKDPPPPFDVGKFVGIFAAIGLALGAIGTVIAAALGGFMKLQWWKMPIALLGIMLLISGPSMIIAYLKLRKRNLAPVLDANGWAINAQVIVNIQFGRTLTQLAELPGGARINMNDPFRKKNSSVLPLVLFLSIIVGVILFCLIKYKVLHF